MKDWKGENIMRDILFRGKRVENNDWVYGDLIHEPWGDCIQVMEKGTKSIEECIEIARESIDSGKAKATFQKFAEINS